MRFAHPAQRWMTQATACLLVFVLGTSAASAQFGSNWRDLGKPDVDTEQLDVIGEMLSFTEDQISFAAGLLEGYQNEIKKLGEDVRAISDGARDEFRTTRDPSVWQDMVAAMQPLAEEKDEITESFMDDLRLILEPEQDERWFEVERYHRRYVSFSDDGLLSGETVDVIAAVQDMDLGASSMAELTPILDQYAMEIDRALIERNEIYEESMEGAMELWRNSDFEEMQRRYDKARDIAEKVRDMNRRFARQIEVALDEQDARRWSDAFKERSFPRVYRATMTANAISTALEFDDLSVEQLERIDEMRSEYRGRTEIMNDAIADAIEESEMSRSVMSLFGRGRGNDESGELRETRDKRRELDNEYMDKLRAILTDEQAERLPERDNRDWRDRLPRRRG